MYRQTVAYAEIRSIRPWWKDEDESMKYKCGSQRSSDALVTVDLEHEGLQIDVNSKLEKMFGKLMEQACMDVLNEMKISKVHVIVDDYGALDFVIRARLRTALKRAQSAV